MRFSEVSSARAQGNFCPYVWSHFSSFLIDVAKVQIFHCGLRILAQLFSIFLFGLDHEDKGTLPIRETAEKFAARCSVAVLQRLFHIQNLLLYLYLYIYKYKYRSKFWIWKSLWRTATLQRAANFSAVSRIGRVPLSSWSRPNKKIEKSWARIRRPQ